MASPSCDFGDSVRILKIPYQALGRSALFRLGNQFDIVTARDLAPLETATVIRTANRTISNWKALAVELEKDFGMLGSLKALDGREGRLWHSPDHWKMPLLSQRLAEGARYESKKLQDDCISAVNLIREIYRKPQREIYRAVFPCINHENITSIIRRLGIGHLFVQTLREKHRKHPSWEQQLLEALDSLVQNFPAQTILKEAGCLNQLNRSGIRQVLRLYRNAFIIPSKSQSKVRVQCLFCKQEGNEVRLSHIVECVDFEAACFHAMSFQAQKSVVKWLPTNSHMLLRLLLSFKDLSSCDKQLALDMYAVLGLAIHAGIHNASLSAIEIGCIAKAKLGGR